MNDTRKYLDHLTRETADTVTGKILERRSNGTYLYEDIATGAIRFATANLRDEFAIGSRVRIDRVSASRGTIGSQDTILTRAPREQRGLSATTPAEDRRGTDRVVIQSVTPDPLEIHAGGEIGEQTFEGTGFDSQAAVYVSSYEGGPDPDLTDESAPVVSDTSVAMTISAALGSARGDFDAIINGARARKALRILRPPSHAYGYFVMLNVLTDDVRSVHTTMGDDDPELIDSVYSGGDARRIVQIDNERYLIFFNGGGGRVATVDPGTGAITLGAMGTHPQLWAWRGQVAFADDFAYYGDSANRFVEVNINTGAVARVLIAAAATPFRAAHYHAASDGLYTGNSTANGGLLQVARIERASGDINDWLTIDTESSTAISADTIGSAGNEIYVFASHESSLSAQPKLQHWTSVGNFVAQSAGGSTGFRGNGSVIARNGRVFVAIESMTGSIASIRSYVDDMSTWESAFTSGSQRSCVGLVVIPQAQTPLGVDTVWMLYNKGTTTEQRAYPADGSTIMPSVYGGFYSLAIGSNRGFGWTAV